MSLSRRRFLQASSAAVVGTGLLTGSAQTLSAAEPRSLIIDTHQHLWDLKKFKLPWLEGAPEVLRHTFHTPEYKAATKGLNVKAVYMEVDVDPKQHVAEAQHVIELSGDAAHPTIGAVVGGRPDSDGFAAYLDKFKGQTALKGVRQVLHPDGTPKGHCLSKEFIRGVQALGERGLSFDLCMRPMELRDGVKLAKKCPDTRFVVDHCGNGDPTAFMKKPPTDKKPWHEVKPWKRSIGALAKQPNVICKISGIVARAPKGWTAEHLAPLVNHCLDEFGPDRVVFGGDWPVCLLGAPLRGWIDALTEIIAERPAADQRKLWHENALKFYSLKA